jgi:hypothetical protein
MARASNQTTVVYLVASEFFHLGALHISLTRRGGSTPSLSALAGNSTQSQPGHFYFWTTPESRECAFPGQRPTPLAQLLMDRDCLAYALWLLRSSKLSRRRPGRRFPQTPLGRGVLYQVKTKSLPTAIRMLSPGVLRISPNRCGVSPHSVCALAWDPTQPEPGRSVSS